MWGSDNEHETQELFKTLKKLLRSGSFNLRKFKTNSPRLEEVIDNIEGGRQSDFLEENLQEVNCWATMSSSLQRAEDIGSLLGCSVSLLPVQL